MIDHPANRRRVVPEHCLVAPPEAERAHGPAMHNARARQAPHQLNGQPLGPLRRGARHGNDPHGRQQSLRAIASGALATTTSPSPCKTERSP